MELLFDPVTTDDSTFQPLATMPRGHKCILLTRGGVAVIGVLTNDAGGYVAWAPLPRIPPEIKELLR